MLDLTLSFGWFSFSLTQIYCVFCLSKQQDIRKLPGPILRWGVLIAYLPDSAVHFLTHTSFFSPQFYFCFLTLLSLLRSAVHFRNTSEMEHFLPVPKRVRKWKKYNSIVVFWLSMLDCDSMAWHPLSWEKGRKNKSVRKWACAIHPS